MDARPVLEIERERSAFELIGATLAVYRRYPWLFLILAAIVVLPYRALDALPELEILHGAARGWLGFFLGIGELAVVVPLVSALHVFAVDDVRQGQEPQIMSAARRGIAKLSVVSPAVFLSWMGISLGLAALIVPGIALAARWAVVGQTASLRTGSWEDAFTRSKHLTDGRYRHVLGLLLLVFLITTLPTVVVFLLFGLKSTAVAPFLIRSALAVVTSSFTALATALLFFDLEARPQTSSASLATQGPYEPRTTSGRLRPPTGHPLDPASWTDEERPAGWYIDPGAPENMHYWAADGAGVWSKRTAKTPKATLAEWRQVSSS